MSVLIHRTDSTPFLCGVCARQAVGIGYTPASRQPILWICDDVECIQIARNTYAMKQDVFSVLEARAVEDGGNEGGQYLDAIKKTNLAELTEEEWCDFCRHIVAGYRVGLKRRLESGEAPF